MEPDPLGMLFFLNPLSVVLLCRGHKELLAVSAAIQTVLSTPVSVAAALKGIQKTLGKALPFKVLNLCKLSWFFPLIEFGLCFDVVCLLFTADGGG